MSQISLPFEVGQTVEVRSFELGYRGAWFRCKILKIFTKGRALFYDVEYLDFPDEGIHTTKVFQQLEDGNETFLMIRPVFPKTCHENEVLIKEDGLEEALVVHECWKVGDLVDWWTDYCYWSGTILEVRENEPVQIELLPPPYGEGSEYEAMSKDLRPSLEWSLEDGWAVPFSKDGKMRQCAKLTKHFNEDQVGGGLSKEEEKQRPSDEVSGAEDGWAVPFSKDGIKRQCAKLTKHFNEDQVSGALSKEEEKQRPSDEVSGAESRDAENQRRLKEQLKSNGDLRLNIMESESVEAAVMDLEELIVRLEWLKGMLDPNSSEKSYWVVGI